MKTHSITSTKQRLLDIAVLILVEKGASELTLERVAERSGISKGGLFHHYASKEKLMLDVAEHVAIAFTQVTERRAQCDPVTFGRSARAYLNTVFDDAPQHAHNPHAVIGHCGAWVNDAMAPIRQHASDWLDCDHADHSEPLGALVVRLAVDGLWLSDQYNIYAMNDGLRAELRDFLVTMTLPRQTISR